MNYVFEKLGYRRYEWKCDHLNQSSGNAAKRLGFTYEGTFRKHVVYKGGHVIRTGFLLLIKIGLN